MEEFSFLIKNYLFSERKSCYFFIDNKEHKDIEETKSNNERRLVHS